MADMLRRVAEWGRKLLIAFTVVLAAGMLAVITAIFGLVLASVAILMRFAGRNTRFDVRRAEPQSGSTLTLEAKRTARGWTVE